MSTTIGIHGASLNTLTNYVSYREPGTAAQSRIGHLDLETYLITPLSFVSGTPLNDLYQVIEAGEENIKVAGRPFSREDVDVLAPISGRDILCVGKNYAEHALEFHSSGYDSSDKVAQPTDPVIFTKRATSIIADGEAIFPHTNFTESLDYEGEIGVIIGKAGFRISENDAMNHVWGYTIVNDVTARERQRDHKQFYIGKSADTFCPMGPIAVPAYKLPKTLRVQTWVNGEPRQDSTTEKLIFPIPILIKTLSEGQTLQPGDVLATGTPAGVGFGQKPPVFLKSGDVVKISVTGLGSLSNPIAGASSTNQTVRRVLDTTHIPIANLAKTNGAGLTKINGKQLLYRKSGKSSSPSIVFIHGLGATNDYFTPLIRLLDLESSHSLYMFDLEGHGLSPTSANSVVSIATYASDIAALVQAASISNATIIAHDIGCIIALQLALRHQHISFRALVLIGPPPLPLPETVQEGALAMASAVRSQGMSAIIDDIVLGQTSGKTQARNPLAIAALRISLLGQDPEGYAKGCTAWAEWDENFALSQIAANTLIITGSDDNLSPITTCEKYASEMKSAKLLVLDRVGHWPIFEDPDGVADAIGEFCDGQSL